MSFRQLVLSAAVVAASVTSAHAVVYVNQNFDSTADGTFPFNAGTGTGGSLGRFEGGGGTVRVTSSQFTGPSGKSVAFTNSTANTAIVGFLPTLNSGEIEISFDFNLLGGESTATMYFGGANAYGQAASHLTLTAGHAFLVAGDGGATTATFVDRPFLNSYNSTVWNNIRFVFDVTAKTFDFYVNNTLKADNFNFEDAYSGNFSTQNAPAFDVGSNFKRTDAGGVPVPSLYVDNVVVQSVPEPTAIAMLSLAAMPLLRRRRV